MISLKAGPAVQSRLMAFMIYIMCLLFLLILNKYKFVPVISTDPKTQLSYPYQFLFLTGEAVSYRFCLYAS